MNNLVKAAACIFAAAAVISCSFSASGEIATEELSFAKETANFSDSVQIEVPLGKNEVSTAIRSALFQSVENSFSHFANPEEDIQKCGATTDEISEDELEAFIKAKENQIISQNEADSTTSYCCTVNIKKVYETEKVCVFSQEDYVYSGGAHGGLGLYYWYFDKSTGEQITKIMKDGSEKDLQGYIRKGLCEYFEVTDSSLAECLFEGDSLIPLPVENPCPGEKGLTFTYGQYEIAAYAAGMPTFTLTWEEAEPYLSTSLLP